MKILKLNGIFDKRRMVIEKTGISAGRITKFNLE